MSKSGSFARRHGALAILGAAALSLPAAFHGTVGPAVASVALPAVGVACQALREPRGMVHSDAIREDVEFVAVRTAAYAMADGALDEPDRFRIVQACAKLRALVAEEGSSASGAALLERLRVIVPYHDAAVLADVALPPLYQAVYLESSAQLLDVATAAAEAGAATAGG